MAQRSISFPNVSVRMRSASFSNSSSGALIMSVSGIIRNLGALSTSPPVIFSAFFAKPLCLCVKISIRLTKTRRTQRITLPETIPPISVSMFHGRIIAFGRESYNKHLPVISASRVGHESECKREKILIFLHSVVFRLTYYPSAVTIVVYGTSVRRMIKRHDLY